MSLCALNQQFAMVARNPFSSSDTEDIKTAAIDAPPALLITSLTRIDDNHSSDPRDRHVSNPFQSNHHVFGNVYTTRPIDAKHLREIGQESSSQGEAFRSGPHVGVMTGQLQMRDADRTWRRSRPAARTTKQSSWWEDLGDNPVDSDIDLIGDSDNESDPPTPPRIPAFYESSFTAPPESSQEKQLQAIQRDDLALLRFLPASGVGAQPAKSEIVSTIKRKLEVNDEAAVGIKKKLSVKSSLDLLEMRCSGKKFGNKSTPQHLQNSAKYNIGSQSQESQSTTISTQSQSRPLGIVKNPHLTKATFLQRQFS